MHCDAMDHGAGRCDNDQCDAGYAVDVRSTKMCIPGVHCHLYFVCSLF